MSVPLSLGIDFGTSHTVAVLRRADGNVTPLLFDGSPLLPSAVYADASGRLTAGRDAVHSARLDPARFEPNPKRRVDDGDLLLGGTDVPVTAAFACVLDRVRQECLRVAGVLPPVTVTHPAGWGPARRQILVEGAEAAGLGEPRLLPEPVAAAAYFTTARGQAVPAGSALVVYDLGGGTFDVSVVARVGGGFEVLAVDGATDLGGVDIDHALYTHLARGHGGEDGTKPLLEPGTPAERRQAKAFAEDVRVVKERLSRESTVDLYVPFADRDVHVTREELERLTAPLLDKAVRLTEVVIRASKIDRTRIAGVFLVGGASRMPLAATTLHRATGMAPTVLDQPELVVAEGATIGPSVPNMPTAPSTTDWATVPASAAVQAAVAAGTRPAVPTAPSPNAAAARPQHAAAAPPSSYPPPAPDPGRPLNTEPEAPGWHQATRFLMWIQAAFALIFSAALLEGVGDAIKNHPHDVPLVIAQIAGTAAIAGASAWTGARLSRHDPKVRWIAIAVQLFSLVLACASLYRLLSVRTGAVSAVISVTCALPIIGLLATDKAGAWFTRR